ncbi:unnamed protein product, partial [Effrenium voratum]
PALHPGLRLRGQQTHPPRRDRRGALRATAETPGDEGGPAAQIHRRPHRGPPEHRAQRHQRAPG